MNGIWWLVIVPLVALALCLAFERRLESGSRRWNARLGSPKD
jgi:hypothetical protein